MLVTGSAGFIGFHMARRLLRLGHEVVGLDGFTAHYDVGLKRSRHARLVREPGFSSHEVLLQDADRLSAIVRRRRPDVVVHCAAQAGVRPSVDQPHGYVETNLVGTLNLLEAARTAELQHLLLASSSSVYGGNATAPFRETDRADHPLSPYAATKKAAEEMAHAYAHLWKIPTTAMRFFTVYGPWGRPDMALFTFVRAMLAGEPIDVFGHGRMTRDFTYVRDIVDAVVRLIGLPPVEGRPVAPFDSLSPAAPFRIVNVGGGRPVPLADWIEAIERALGRRARRNLLDAPKGDPAMTFAAVDLLVRLVGAAPQTPVAEGVAEFVRWYRNYYESERAPALPGTAP